MTGNQSRNIKTQPDIIYSGEKKILIGKRPNELKQKAVDDFNEEHLDNKSK